jgi:alpha-beta hydrolase superfamily lysophospholipase
MSRFTDLTAASGRRLLRAARWLALAVLGLCAAVALGFTLYAVGALPPLSPWHTTRLAGEFDARRDAGLDFDGYLKLEERLFAELAQQTAAWPRNEAFATSRFNRDSAVQRLADGAPYNRTFRLTATPARGSALLLHGLTDSPYSMRALADSLHARGFDVTVLRLPGHGTLPAMLTEVSYDDWWQATLIAARAVAARTPAGAPFYVGGYSTGGTLALLYALHSLQDPALRRPTRVLLVSPAIELTRVAALASIIDVASVVPIPVLEKVRWQEIVPEFDPYKYNSFPVNASRQVNRATRTLQAALERAAVDGRLREMPPVVAWQSVVDSTVGANGVVDRLFGALDGPQHRLVLFDVNRNNVYQSVQRPAARQLLERSAERRRRTTMDVVTNHDTGHDAVVVHRLAPDAKAVTRETPYAWPRDLVSLGHVALPFRPDDAVYGIASGSGHAGIPSIGSWLLRGESGATTIGLGSLTRVRSNPFWPLIDADIGELVAADTAR